jgi:hypothetical protein
MKATGGRQKPTAGVLGLVTYAAALASIWFVVIAV